MRYLLPASIVCALALGSALAVAQSAGRPGIHVVAVPRGVTTAKQVESTTLLETPHLKLRSLVVPKGGLAPAHAAPGQLSVQALSGAGELRMGDHSERLDVTRVVVLAPGAVHEVRAGASADLVLLVHEVAAGPRAGGRMGRGMDRPGMGMGMGRGMGPGPTALPPPVTK